MPEVVAAHRKYRERGLRVLGVNVDSASKLEAVRETAARLGATWPHVHDGKGSTGPLVGLNDVRAFPTTFLLDRKGRARFVDLSGPELHRRIEQLLDE